MQKHGDVMMSLILYSHSIRKASNSTVLAVSLPASLPAFAPSNLLHIINIEQCQAIIAVNHKCEMHQVSSRKIHVNSPRLPSLQYLFFASGFRAEIVIICFFCRSLGRYPWSELKYARTLFVGGRKFEQWLLKV